MGITIKMQCHSRRLLVKVVYDAKKEEKKALYSIQHNIRLYLTCRDWTWYKYYTMVKGESEKLKKKMAEEERKWRRDLPNSRLRSTRWWRSVKRRRRKTTRK